jgi:hypothetical protein
LTVVGEEEEKEGVKTYFAGVVNWHVHMACILLMQVTVAKREANCETQWRYSSGTDVLSVGEVQLIEDQVCLDSPQHW